MQKNKLFIKYEEVLNRPDLVEDIVVQLLHWIGHPDQSLINAYFTDKLEHFNSNQFKQFINNNSLPLLESIETPIAKEVCLLIKLLISEKATTSFDYIRSHVDFFPSIKGNPSILNLQDKTSFIAQIKDKYATTLSYEVLEQITKMKESPQYGLTTIENAFSCFDLDATVLFDLSMSHSTAVKDKAKDVFFRKLKKTFSSDVIIDMIIIDDFIQNNALEIYEFLGFRANKENLLKYLDLSVEKIEAIQQDQANRLNSLTQKLTEEKDAIKLEKEKERQLRIWKKTLIHAKEVPSYLAIKLSQFNKWKGDGRIPVADTVSFKKWGKKLSATKHDPTILSAMTPEVIAQWIMEDNKNKVKKTRVILQSSKDKAQWTRSWNKQKKELQTQGFVFDKDTVAQKYAIEFKLEGDVFKQNLFFKLPLKDVVKEKEKALLDFANHTFSQHSVEVLSLRLKEQIQILISQYLGQITDIQEKIFIHESLILFIHQENYLNTLFDSSLEEHFKQLHVELAVLRSQKSVREVLDLDDYANNFPIARKLDRKIKLIVGPTNSGKTFDALESLKRAKSGVYLAPLRLLAMEVYDKLNLAGIPCSLHTGEEHVDTPGAKHTASTIEMMNPKNIVDVAVIDEFQMLKDSGRGSSWTAALTGVAAKEVFAVGSREALEMTVQLFKYLKEDYSITELERKTPLFLLKDPVTVNDVKKQDIVVAFTRKDVLNIAAQLRKRGLTVSVIYGSLSPEVRRKQSELFLSGTHDVVVATDAIGMGLNLPAQRVIFSTTSKFDGKEKRKLLSGEIKQIAGRAGRFGLFEKGEYSAFSRYDLNFLKEIQNEKLNESFEQMQIAPSLKHVLDLKKHLALNDNKIHSLIYYFSQEFGIQNPLFKNASLDSMLELAIIVDQLAPDMPMQDKFTCICAPVSINKEDDINYYKKTILALKDKEEMELFFLPEWINEEDSQNLEKAENLSKNLSIYSWLSYRYKDIFVERDVVPLYRSKLSQYIASRLVKEKSPFVEWWS